MEPGGGAEGAGRIDSVSEIPGSPGRGLAPSLVPWTPLLDIPGYRHVAWPLATASPKAGTGRIVEDPQIGNF